MNTNKKKYVTIKPTSFKDYIVAALEIGIISGLLFGIVFALLYNDPFFGLRAGVFGGFFFGITYTSAMWLLSLILELKYSKLRNKIDEQRLIVCNGGASNKGNGGWLFFTENGIEFYPHKINFSSKKIIIPIKLIQNVDNVGNVLIVYITNDIYYEFVVFQSNKWRKNIEEYLSGVSKDKDRGTENEEPVFQNYISENAAPFDPESKYVFISYSSDDQPKAESTRFLLNERGIKTWMAPYDIPAGSKYAHVINDAIEKCCCVLLLLSDNAQASQFVEREIERAVAYNKTIVSMNLDNCELNSGFKFFLGQEQIIPVKEINPENFHVKK